MRISIEHKEKQTGLIFKTTRHQVFVKVDFNNEELSTIRKRDLSNMIIMERDPDPRKARGLTADELRDLADVWYLKMPGLMKGDTYTFDTPAEARQYEDNVKAKLRQLKGYLEANATAPEGALHYEL